MMILTMIWTVWFNKLPNQQPYIPRTQLYQLLSRDQNHRPKLENSLSPRLLIIQRVKIWMNSIRQCQKNMIDNSLKSINTILRLSKRKNRKLPTSNGNSKSQSKKRVQDSSMLRSLLRQQLMEMISHQTLTILLLWLWRLNRNLSLGLEQEKMIQQLPTQELKLVMTWRMIGILHRS